MTPCRKADHGIYLRDINFDIPSRITCNADSDFSGSCRYPVQIVSWEFVFLEKCASKCKFFLDFKECTIFSVVANLSMNAKIVNDFSVQNHDLVVVAAFSWY